MPLFTIEATLRFLSYKDHDADTCLRFAAKYPVRMVDHLHSELKKWADGRHLLGSGCSRIAAELADMPGHQARHAAPSQKMNIENWLSDRFASTGLDNPSEVAQQVTILIEGGMNLSLIHGDTSYIETARNAVVCLLSKVEVNEKLLIGIRIPDVRYVTASR